MELNTLEKRNKRVKSGSPEIDVNEPSAVKAFIDKLYDGEFNFPENFSFYQQLCSQYANIEALNFAFFAAYNKSIEQYRIEYRTNKIKELLVYTHLSLSEIAARLGFQHTDHLLIMLEQQTGLTPTFFKQIKKQKKALINSIHGEDGQFVK